MGVHMLRRSYKQIHRANLLYLRLEGFAGNKLALKGGRVRVTRRNQVTRKEGRDFREKLTSSATP